MSKLVSRLESNFAGMGRTLRTVIFTGNVRLDHFGRYVVDECQSDEAHLRVPVKEGEERSTCRNLVEEAFAGLEGQHGRLRVEIFFIPEAA